MANGKRSRFNEQSGRKGMSNRPLSELVAAALAVALGSISAATVGARGKRNNEAEGEQKAKTAGEEHAASGTKNCYGLVLHGRNEFKNAPRTTCTESCIVDYQGKAPKLVPKGTCLIMKPPIEDDSPKPKT
jgi:uncharacterized membrane protein